MSVGPRVAAVALASCWLAIVVPTIFGLPKQSWNGVLRNEQGKPIAEAVITLHGTTGNTGYHALSSASGQFAFADLPADSYDLSVSVAGRTWKTPKPLILRDGTALISGLIAPASGDELFVSSETDPSQTQSSGGEHLSGGEVSSLPLNERDFSKLLLLAAGLPLIVSAHLILRVWVGGDYASHTTSIVQILVAATIIRLCVTPYTVAMIGSGEQRLIILTPILEGVSNLVCSLVAGYFLGALGVALGTLIGAIVGVLGMLFYNMRRTTAIQLTRLEYIKNSLFRPVLCVAPLIILSSIDATGIAVPILATHALQIAAGCTTIFMFWMVGLRPQERHALVNKMLSKAH